MLLTLVIILVLIWSAVVGSIYSNFLVFYQNFTETENYHRARYASTAAIERAELVIKQRQPWYIWSWWWILGEYWSTWTNNQSDKIISWFSYLSNTNDSENESTLFWKINSRTNQIPAPWKWNVDKLLSTGDSKDYNMMDYDNSEIVLLYYDKWDGNPYLPSEDGLQKSNLEQIKLKIRLPWFIKDAFGSLDILKSLTPEWQTRYQPNDVIVDRQLRWIYTDEPFTIFATQRYNTPADSAIRENDINNQRNIEYNELMRNPILTSRDPSETLGLDYDPTDTLTIISPKDESIKDLSKELPDDRYYKWLFSRSDQLQYKLSLLNLLQSRTGMIYPFLEYKIEFNPSAITLSDKYYTIQTEWNYWDYKVDTVIYKPTITESILKSFTTIF